MINVPEEKDVDRSVPVTGKLVPRDYHATVSLVEVL